MFVVGFGEGLIVGIGVGLSEGKFVGYFDGMSVGSPVGFRDGIEVGESVGIEEGTGKAVWKALLWTLVLVELSVLLSVEG